MVVRPALISNAQIKPLGAASLITASKQDGKIITAASAAGSQQQIILPSGQKGAFILAPAPQQGAGVSQLAGSTQGQAILIQQSPPKGQGPPNVIASASGPIPVQPKPQLARVGPQSTLQKVSLPGQSAGQKTLPGQSTVRKVSLPGQAESAQTSTSGETTMQIHAEIPLDTVQPTQPQLHTVQLR